jgi:uncharacterized protein YfaS (alpha-2-macroglobulin family)
MKRLLSLLAGIGFAGVLLAYGVTQEVPLGGVEGSLRMLENGKPLVKAMVTFTPMSDLDKEIIRPRFKRTSEDGTFVFRDIPSGAYEMDVSAEHHEFKPRFVWIEEGKTTDLKAIDLKPVDPYLKLYASQRVFMPKEKPGLELHGFVDTDVVKIKVYQLGLDYLAQNGDLGSALYPIARDTAKLEKAGKVVTTIQHKVERRDSEGAFIDQLSIPVLPEGFYVVRCFAKNLAESTFLNITSISLVSKSANGKALAFASDLESGKPLAGIDVFTWQAGLKPVGKTSADGTIEATYQGQGQPVLIARRGKSLALVGFSNDNSRESKMHITSYTDRPVYRPGDEIHFKGIVRSGEGDNMVVPRQGQVSVELRDNDGNAVQTVQAQIGPHGTYDGTFTTNPEVDPGDWSIVSEIGGSEDYLYLPISAYRKPEFTVNVSSTEPYFILGNQASAKIKCEYYFGGPVPGAKVKVSVYRNPIYSFESDEESDGDDYEFEDSFVGGEYSQEIDAVTDANGEVVVNFDTKAEGDPEDYPTDYTYNVIASVADAGDKYFDGQGSVRVVRGAFDLSVSTDQYVVKPGDDVPFTVKTESHDGKPLSNTKVSVVVGMERWTNRAAFFEPTKTYDVVTDAKGVATLRVPASEGGTLKALATAKDAEGNRIASDASSWVSAEGADWYPGLGDFKLTLDKRSYQPNQTATVLLQTSKTGGSALVTVEADRVLWSKVVPLDSESVTVEIPVVKAYAPNAFVAAAYVKNKKFYTAERKLRIDRSDRNLNVSVTPSQKNYEPGDVAKVTIKTTNDSGAPEPANLSLAVVDESIYAIRSDSTDILKALYPQQYNQVSTSYSFPEVYLDGGDKGGPDLRLRSKFRDTAFWAPNVNTDANGLATLTFTLPDNLTEWRATAIGITDQNSAGMSRAQFKARKELMVRLQPPMYLTQYDQQHMSVVVTNDTGKDQDVNVTVASEGVDLEGEGRQKIHVLAGTPVALDFTLKAPQAGTGKLTAKAWVDGGPNDGVTQELPIHPYGRLLVETHAGVADKDASSTVKVVDTASPNTGELIVNVSPSLAGGLTQSLPALVDYPYGCVEQTMSRFMPAMVVSNAMKELGLSLPGVSAKLPAIADQSYMRLAKMENGTGGWGWWENDEPEPFMTALVLDGIARAKEAGYAPRYVDVKSAVDAAAKLSKSPPKTEYFLAQWNRDRIYLAYVLAKFDRKAEAAKILNAFPIKSSGPAEAALAALTAERLGDEAKAEAGLARLREIVQQGPTTANWAPQIYSYGEEPTALALTAFLAIRPNDPLVTKTVRHLMLSRQGNSWTSTRDTSYAIVALTTYLRQHPEQIDPKQTRHDVTVNGKTVVLIPDENGAATVEIPMQSLQKGDNIVRVSGSAPTFFTVQLNQFDVQKKLDDMPGEGIRVARTYHLLEARRLQDGTTRLMPTDRTIDQAQSGDIVRVELVVTSDVDREYMMVEDPIPSNFRTTERGDIDFGDWGWWWSKTVIRDDRIAFFARWLTKGENKISYNMRAESPGTGGALPTKIENMYDPGQRASNHAQELEVVR